MASLICLPLEARGTVSSSQNHLGTLKSIHSSSVLWIIMAPRPSYPCTQCGKVLRRRSSLNDHLARHYEVNAVKFQCGECDKKLSTKASLARHVRAHFWTNTKPFECTECDLKFKREGIWKDINWMCTRLDRNPSQDINATCVGLVLNKRQNSYFISTPITTIWVSVQ